VNLIAYQCAKALIHQLVARQSTLTLEFSRDYKRLEMRVIVAEDFDGRIIKSGCDQIAYLDWVHGCQMLR